MTNTAKSVAHRFGMNHYGASHWADGLVEWNDPVPPKASGPDHGTGRLRSCGYCGSMHPADVAAAIREGATGSWADKKYGWPHKAYFDGVPNPHAGLLETTGSANFEKPGWIAGEGKNWYEPPRPARPTTHAKFYSVHLQDATDEDRKLIETHLGLAFTFSDSGSVSWQPVR